jgi:RNA polymerase-interacting CarD/CdnL/TRCF family regulator
MSNQGPSQPAPEGLVHAASEIRPGDYVIYPGQGVHRVAGFERVDIAGQQLDVLKLAREHDGATVIVPVEKVPSTGLRRVAGRELVEDVFHLLAAHGRHVELDWKERHRGIGERLMGGGVLGVAEVLKELHDLSDIRPPPPKERAQYDEARDLLVHEVAVSMAVPPALAEDYIDYALTPPAGVKLPLKPIPKLPSARWVPRRPEAGHPPKELEEGPGVEEMQREPTPGEEGAPLTVEKKPEGRERAATGKRARKAGQKKRAPQKRGAKKARPTKRRVGKKLRPKRTSRARR